MTGTEWIIIGIVAAIIVIFLAWKITKFCKMTPQQKKEIIKEWLIDTIVATQSAIAISSAKVEEIQVVIEKFKKQAPMLCKILLATTNTANLEELIKEALDTIKSSLTDND